MKYNKMKWKKRIKCLLRAVPTEGSRNNQSVRLRASHCAALPDLRWPVCLEWSNNVMVTKRPLSQRGNTSSRLIWPKCLPSGGRSWAAPPTAELRWRGRGWRRHQGRDSPARGWFQRSWWGTPGRRSLCPTLEQKFLGNTGDGIHRNTMT